MNDTFLWYPPPFFQQQFGVYSSRFDDQNHPSNLPLLAPAWHRPRCCGLATSRRRCCRDAQGSSTTRHKAAAAAAATGTRPGGGKCWQPAKVDRTTGNILLENVDRTTRKHSLDILWICLDGVSNASSYLDRPTTMTLPWHLHILRQDADGIGCHHRQKAP